MLEISVAEEAAHVFLFLDPYPVLTREHSACVERRFDNLGSRSVHPVENARFTTVEDDQRMEVSVARMEHVHDHQLVTSTDLIDRREHLGERGARHNSVAVSYTHLTLPTTPYV